MTHKFTQPVSMACTVEEYEKDLKYKLLAMGYKEKDMCRGNGEYNILCTNYSCRNNELWLGSDYQKTDHNRYFIDHYNPNLFLAMAAMTEGEIPIVGEWMICIKKTPKDDVNSFEKGELIQVTSIRENQYGRGIGDFGLQYNRTYFRKANKEEIIKHFTKQETMNIQELSKDELLKLKEQIEKELTKPDPKPINLHSGQVDGMRLFGNIIAVAIFKNDAFWLNPDYNWELNGNRLKISRK